MAIKKFITLIGGGDHASSVIEAMPPDLRASYFVDPNPADGIAGLTRIASDEEFLAGFSPEEALVLITMVSGADCSMAPRRRLIERYSKFGSPVVVAPTAWTAPSAIISEGAMVMHRTALNFNVFVGRHSIINTGAVIEHDCRIGSNVFIGPGAVLCGSVTVGRDSYIGAGAVIRPGVTVCEGSVIGLGAAVVADITEPGVYLGVPAIRRL